MEPGTLVVAILLAMASDGGSLVMVSPPAQMPVEECFDQAAQVNADATTPYIMLCGPIIKQPDGPEYGI